MGALTTDELTHHLHDAARVASKRAIPGAGFDGIGCFLLLKRASDQHELRQARRAAGREPAADTHTGHLRVPEAARWRNITDDRNSPADALNRALWALENANPGALDGVSASGDFRQVAHTPGLLTLMDRFTSLDLSDASLQSPDVIGRAYDRFLSERADGVGRTGGEFHTPRSIVELMVRLVHPEAGQSVYDPCVGSGGMLVAAAQYVWDGSTRRVAAPELFGQDVDAASCATTETNLALHGVFDASIRCGDTLDDPLHTRSSMELRQFDRVLTNPPISTSYSASGMKYSERMVYGFAPEVKRADLMFVQHVLATLAPNGIGATTTPHGVLFHGGAEGDIRRRMIEAGRIDAVIGIGANVFYGTSIPACVLVLRGTEDAHRQRDSGILFINAEREVQTGRSRNHLAARHIERIVTAYRERACIPGLARVVSPTEIAANDYNLNIRRYIGAEARNEPLPDVHGAFFGHVPRSEVAARQAAFDAFHISPEMLLSTRGTKYYDFLDEGYERTAARIPHLTAPREQHLLDVARGWWETYSSTLEEAVQSLSPVELRSGILTAFREQLVGIGVLEPHEVAGALADWWSAHEDDLRTLKYGGASAVLDAWARRQATRRPRAKQKAPTTMSTDFDTVRHALGTSLLTLLETQTAARRQALVSTFLSWGDRYATSLVDMASRQETGAARLADRLRRLGMTDDEPWL
ncbi:N-6 DNA methylase [Embleya sp. NPDC056575]|uniref:N-6 DNA methylase n=1 Tax=unclassified Embleya TaxID=2699296 RepID=UPI0036896259